MRLITIIFLFSFNWVNAQYVFPLFGDSVSWNVLECFWGNCSTEVYTYQYDTTFCGETYSVSEYVPSYTIKLFVRASNGKVYGRSFRNINCSDPEEVFYDFALNQGDTVQVHHILSNDTAIYFADTVYYPIILGIKRKEIHLVTLNGVGKDQVWTQGLGSTIHPFFFIHSLWDGWETDWYRLCADSMNVPIFRNLWGTCDTTWFLGIEDINLSASIRVHPNPAHNKLYIESKKEIKHIEIFNSAGQKMKSEIFSSEIDVSNLNNGLYIIVLRAWNDSIYFDRFIKY